MNKNQLKFPWKVENRFIIVDNEGERIIHVNIPGRNIEKALATVKFIMNAANEAHNKVEGEGVVKIVKGTKAISPKPVKCIRQN